jgi:hypothetical protein
VPRARSCSRCCRWRTRRFVSRTSRAPGSYWDGSRRSASRTGCGESCKRAHGSH